MTEPAAGRLRIRARRGMKELDVLLERYLDARLAEAGVAERQDLLRLLELQDPELAGYLLHGRTPDDAVLARTVARVLAVPPPGRDRA